MKKSMVYLLILAMLFCLMGCGSTRNENMEAAGNGSGNSNNVDDQAISGATGSSSGNLGGNNGQTTDGVTGNVQENPAGQTTGSAVGNGQEYQTGQTAGNATGNAQGNQNGQTANNTAAASGGVPDEPLGKALASDFKKQMKNKTQMDPMELAQKLLNNPAIEFEGALTEVREGYLTGFKDDIDGFERGVMFSPVISSIPFVGYVFLTEDNEDALELKRELKEEADPNWNICSEASQTVVRTAGNMVFFVMCP